MKLNKVTRMKTIEPGEEPLGFLGWAVYKLRFDGITVDNYNELTNWCKSNLKNQWHISGLWLTTNVPNKVANMYLESDDDLFLVKLGW